MENNRVKQFLSNLLNEEAKPVGLKNTEDVQKEEEDVNKEYYKEVGDKMEDLEEPLKAEDPVKFNYEGSEKEYHDEMEIRNGMEMVKYDREPSQSFKDRAVKSIVGDSTMGNETKVGVWNPETGEGNGNTEPVWGASNADFGKELVATVKSATKKRNDAIQPLVQLGDDIELLDKNTKTMGDKKKVAVEGVENNNNNIEPKMKRLKFKKLFGGVDNAINLIPESYKVDDKVFEMTDGNESYRVKWEGDLNEGKAIILSGENTELVNESIAKMKHLFNYNPATSITPVRGSARIEENTKFTELLGKTKSLFNKTKNEE